MNSSHVTCQRQQSSFGNLSRLYHQIGASTGAGICAWSVELLVHNTALDYRGDRGQSVLFQLAVFRDRDAVDHLAGAIGRG